MFLQESIYIHSPLQNIKKIKTSFRKRDIRVGLVLGAYVYPNGNMSPMYHDRVQVALNLYKSGVINKILITGDHSKKDYDEVNTAREFLIKNGVLPQDIFLDHAGFDTYDSMYRAKYVFNVDSLVIITQKYHLYRVIFIARHLGLNAYGASANLRQYVGQPYYSARECLARIKAVYDVFMKSKPTYLGNIIPIQGDGRFSWDRF